MLLSMLFAGAGRELILFRAKPTLNVLTVYVHFLPFPPVSPYFSPCRSPPLTKKWGWGEMLLEPHNMTHFKLGLDNALKVLHINYLGSL